MKKKRNKWIAFLLALAFGYLGLHRFYLRQNGLGILYVALALTGISLILGLIDAIAFFFMSYDRFNKKYNKQWYDKGYRHPRRFPLRSQNKKKNIESAEESLTELKRQGILHFKAYELEEAKEFFQRALEAQPDDIALHFNLACTNALLENKEDAWIHLQSAVELGFDDKEKIDTHPALAFLRIQTDWNEKRREWDQKRKGLPDPSQRPRPLFQQLGALSRAREEGILTENEFEQKRQQLLRPTADDSPPTESRDSK
jgi:TM2 domain-containing membrane protein YozV